MKRGADMSSITGTVVSMRRDKLGFKLDNGEWYENMEGPPMEHVPWKGVVTFDFQSGGGKNFITGEVKVDKAAPQGGPSGGGARSYAGSGSKWHAYQDKEWQQAVNERITKQNALTNAVNFVTGTEGDKGVDVILSVASEFVSWVNGK